MTQPARANGRVTTRGCGVKFHNGLMLLSRWPITHSELLQVRTPPPPPPSPAAPKHTPFHVALLTLDEALQYRRTAGLEKAFAQKSHLEATVAVPGIGPVAHTRSPSATLPPFPCNPIFGQAVPVKVEGVSAGCQHCRHG